MTMPDGTVTCGRFSTIAAVTTEGAITMADGSDELNEPRWFRAVEFGFTACKTPAAWRLQSELSDQPEAL